MSNGIDILYLHDLKNNKISIEDIYGDDIIKTRCDILKSNLTILLVGSKFKILKTRWSYDDYPEGFIGSTSEHLHKVLAQFFMWY